MQKIQFGFRYSKIFLKMNVFDENLVRNCIKDYIEFLKVELVLGKKCFELECRLVDNSMDLKKLSKEFLEYLEDNAYL